MIGLLALPAATTLAIFVAVWLWAGAYDERPTVRLLASLVLTSWIIVALQVTLGGAGILRPLPLGVAAWAVAILATLSWGIWARAGAGLGALPRLRPPSRLGLALGILTVVSYAAVTAIGFVVPVYGWDSLVYHLTAVYHIAQSGSLEVFPFPGRAFYYPQVGELHASWVYLLSGAGSQSWRATGLALVPLALPAGVATRAVAEGLGFRRCLPWVVAAVMLAPIALIQPLAGYVDVAFAAFVLAALAFAVLVAVEGRFEHVAFCALASGLALGTKISFLYFGVPVLVVLATPRAWRWLARAGARAVVGRLVLSTALFAVGCGYWLGRNALRNGNPIYPNRVEIAGLTVLAGPKAIEPAARQQEWFVPSATSWLRYPFRETIHGKPAYTLENGFGPIFAAGLLLTPAALWIAAREKRWDQFRVVLGLPLTLGLFFLINPYREPRYVVAACGFAALSLALVVEAAASPGPTRRADSVLTAALCGGIAFAAAGGVVSASPDLGAVLAEWRRGTWSPQRIYTLEYGAAGDAFNWIADTTRGGATVTFNQATFVAPLFGWHGRNRVVYASAGDDEPIGEPSRRATYASWRRFLLENGVERIVVWIPWWGGESARKIDGWIDRHAQDFEELAGFGGRVRVFRPVFGEREIVSLQRAPTNPTTEDLGSPDMWRVEYGQGSRVTLSEDPAGGLKLEYGFDTVTNDYVDLRTDLSFTDLLRPSTLSFEIESRIDVPTLLFVWLKNEDPKRAARYRVELPVREERRAVRIPLASPEWRAEGFDLADVRELHLVLDDAEDPAIGGGILRISGFALGGPQEGSR